MMLLPESGASALGQHSRQSTLAGAPTAAQDTATRKQQQPLSAISIQDLNSVQLRRTSTDKLTTMMMGKPAHGGPGAPTRSMSMQCLSSTNESFLSQKIDLIAELKASKDITGIKKMKVERAKLEDRHEKELYSDITKQFTANNFVDQVGGPLHVRHTTFLLFYYYYYYSN